MIASAFLCPIGGEAAGIHPILTSKGERQAVICETHGVLAWVGTGPVANFGGGVQASFSTTAQKIDDLSAGEYAYSPTGPFKGVWAVYPPAANAVPVLVPTEYARVASGWPASGMDPALSVTIPLTGRWSGSLQSGIWLEATDVL